jgi:hypothetical protein
VSDTPSFDLAALDNWHGVRPGMPRSEVLAAMQERGIEATPYGDDNITANAGEWEMEFYFATDGSERLRQLSIEGDAVLWSGKPLMGVRVDDAWRTFGSPASGVWEANDAIGEPFPEMDEEPAEPVSDEELLEEGTIWLPECGVGLVICDGEVIGVAWRAAQDLPKRFAGPLTEAQRQLSKRPDLESHLRAKRMERYKLNERKAPFSKLRGALTVAAIVALALIGREGFHEMKLWNQAPTLTAKLVAIERTPMKQFREYVPPALRWMFPVQRPVEVETYRVEFLDPREERQEVVLERGELYVPPQQIGDEVPVAYVDGNPPRVKGLSRARDSAFVDYMPWAIAVGAVYLLAQIFLSVLPALLRLVPRLTRRLAPTGVVKVHDRPELR